MAQTAIELLAIFTIMFWAIIPLFWIPVHFFSVRLRKMGLKAYLLPLFTWLPLVFIIYKNRHIFLQCQIPLPSALSVSGWALLIIGALLHVWTARLLGIWGIIGVPEVSVKAQRDLVTGGPFSLVRHPTYLAHTLIFSGVFFITGVVPVGIVAIADFLTVSALIIPLEEKELTNRFGKRFIDYKKMVPNRFLPYIF